MAESPNSSLTAFCNGRHMVKGGSIPSSNLERSCFGWGNQNSWKDWKVIVVGITPTTGVRYLYAITVLPMSKPTGFSLINSVGDNSFGIWRAVRGESRLYGSGRGRLLLICLFHIAHFKRIASKLKPHRRDFFLTDCIFLFQWV